MQINFFRAIDSDPKPDEVGTLKLTVDVLEESDYFTFSLSSFVRDFIDECQSKDELNEFLWAAGFTPDDTSYVMTTLVQFVKTCSEEGEFSPLFALNIRVEIDPNDEDDDEDDDDDDDDAEIEEALQVSLDEPNSGSRPASKDVVESLPRKIHNRNIDKEEECSICMEKFKDGGMVVTLPCEHEFDEDCIIKWFETSSVCPLCRYRLPHE